MFTGLIQGLGSIRPLGGDYWQITCNSQSSNVIMNDLAVGDSVAVDGVCLTVEEIFLDGFSATASPETLSRTTLSKKQAGSSNVNLETSLRVGSKLGGHFVTGHIDGIGQMVSTIRTATSWEITFTTSEACARYIVPKGSIAVNGISLTVVEYDSQIMQFKVAVIPHTYDQTNLNNLIPGDWVNLEGDILGKYVEKFLYSGTKELVANNDIKLDEITPTFLTENGYI